MKLTIERSTLLNALGHVQAVVERRNTIPILSHLQIEAAGESLKFRATDLELSVVEESPAVVETPGAATAPAHMLYDIVRKLPEGANVELSLNQERRSLTLEAGRSRFSLACLPNEDFPTIEDDELPHRFTLPAGDLRKLVERTRFAISTEETRYYLNGVYLHIAEDGKQLCAVSTDSHRLARFRIPTPEGAAGLPGVIVPRKAIGEIHRLMGDGDGEIDIAVSDSKIRFHAGATVLTSKLIDASFPDYERVIPASNTKVLEVDAKVFVGAVDRVSTISTEKSRAVKLALEGKGLTLSVNSPNAGSATEEIAASFDAEGMEILFNARYLMEIVEQIEGDNAHFELSDAATAILISDPGDETSLYVIMPVRV